MKRILSYLGLMLVIFCTGVLFWAARQVIASSVPSRGAYRAEWNPANAASYLDYREAWWQSWAGAQLDRGTVCISCHTVVPYALVRPILSAQLGEKGLTPAERTMLSSIGTRVADWSQTTSYYTDPAHSAPSRGTESVLNAFILSSYDQRSGQFAPLTRRAFAEAWALQTATGKGAGGWEWQNFHEAPWESSESAYWGAALMAIAMGNSPEQYKKDPSVHPHWTALQKYLLRTYSEQPPINQIYVIWAAAEVPDLVSDAERRQFIARIEALQQRGGGWSLASLDGLVSRKSRGLDIFRRIDRVDGSDGCGTGLAVLGLEKAGIPGRDPVVRHGLQWLEQHQYQDGSWWAPSLNGLRKPDSELGRFMSDAATGYAVLAMEQAHPAHPVQRAASTPAIRSPSK